MVYYLYCIQPPGGRANILASLHLYRDARKGSEDAQIRNETHPQNQNPSIWLAANQSSERGLCHIDWARREVVSLPERHVRVNKRNHFSTHTQNNYALSHTNWPPQDTKTICLELIRDTETTPKLSIMPLWVLFVCFQRKKVHKKPGLTRPMVTSISLA